MGSGDASVSAYASQVLYDETHRGVNVPRSAWLTQTSDRISGAPDVASSVVAVAVVECTDAMQVHVPPPDRPVPASLVWRSCWGLVGAGGMLLIYHAFVVVCLQAILSACACCHGRAGAALDAQAKTMWCKECKVVFDRQETGLGFLGQRGIFGVESFFYGPKFVKVLEAWVKSESTFRGYFRG